MQLQDYRREYLQGGLRRQQLASDPIAQFEQWMQQSIQAKLPDPTAMTLATVDDQGQPAQRIVLLKQVDHSGFVFFTNKNNPKVSLHFPWYPLERQVSIVGITEPVADSEVVTYFKSRPAESQIAAWASEQSQPIASRDDLLNRYNQLTEKYSDGDIPLPNFWGGYRVVPTRIEFWQGGEYRLHDRFEYSLRLQGGWDIQRLAP